MSEKNLWDIPHETSPAHDPLARVATASPEATIPAVIADENAEAVVKQHILAQLGGHYRSINEYLSDRVRIVYMNRLAKQGFDLAYVTADDARIILDSDPRFPGPDRLNRNFLGSLFKSDDGWEATGKFARSRTPGSHANLLYCWRWNPDRPRNKTKGGVA